MLKSKKAQGWGIDLMIAVVIFSIGLTVFFIYSLNSPGEGKENIELLFYDGEIIANTLLSPGYPKGWDEENVINIGITTNGKINETKLERFYNLAEDNYEKTKLLFNTKYDYYFFISESIIINGGSIEGIGKPGIFVYD